MTKIVSLVDDKLIYDELGVVKEIDLPDNTAITVADGHIIRKGNNVSFLQRNHKVHVEGPGRVLTSDSSPQEHQILQDELSKLVNEIEEPTIETPVEVAPEYQLEAPTPKPKKKKGK